MPQDVVDAYAKILKEKVNYVYSLNYAVSGQCGTGAQFPLEGWETIYETINPPMIMGDVMGEWKEMILRRRNDDGRNG